jgi:hypothetical protein
MNHMKLILIYRANTTLKMIYIYVYIHSFIQNHIQSDFFFLGYKVKKGLTLVDVFLEGTTFTC